MTIDKQIESAGPGERGSVSPIAFRLDHASGVPTYLQLVQQVEHALRLGYLGQGRLVARPVADPARGHRLAGPPARGVNPFRAVRCTRATGPGSERGEGGPLQREPLAGDRDVLA